uniref:Uncharacterized protein n=1 Tax=viral metagenome TaxID=1070528 RepID=A0A6C0HVU3_9ZZZZ
MNKQLGGYINTSIMAEIIVSLSEYYKQSSEKKIAINNSITNTGHGSIFLGSSLRLEGANKNIRMLIGAHFSNSNNDNLEIGVFGGGCEIGELTIDTIIRETIEEIFNIIPNKTIIKNIRDFLNNNTNYYFIVSTSTSTNISYSYIFDVSVLGDFIKIMIENDPSLKVPTVNTMSNLSTYLISNAQFEDKSSFDGEASTNYFPFFIYGDDIPIINYPTINLVKFMNERIVSSEYRSQYKQIGLNEISYLSFASLKKILDSVSSGNYNMYNFTTKQRV